MKAVSQVLVAERVGNILATAKSVSRFFSFNPGANIFYLRDGTIIPYAVIWKCVSEGIIKNLQKLTVLQPKYGTIRQEWIRNQVQMEYVLNAVRHSEGLGDLIIDAPMMCLNLF